MSRGVVYVATGDYFVKRVAISIATLRRFYAGPIMLLTDSPADYFTACAKKYRITVNVQPTGEAHAGLSSRVLKTQAAKFCPYDEALFLDADTLVLRPVRPLWRYFKATQPMAMTLSEFHAKIHDAAGATHMRNRAYAADLRATERLTGPAFPHYSSSTMLWRRTAHVLQLFESWYEEWRQVKGPDMFALARALHKVKLPVATLPRCFNSRRSVAADTVIYTPRITKLVEKCRKCCPGVIRTIMVDWKRWGWK